MKNEQEEKAFCDFLVALGLDLYELDDDSYAASPKTKENGQPSFLVDFTKSLEVNLTNFVNWRRGYLLRTEIYKKTNQKELAAQMGIDKSHISRTLQGNVTMSPVYVQRFSAWLDVTPEDLGY